MITLRRVIILFCVMGIVISGIHILGNTASHKKWVAERVIGMDAEEVIKEEESR